MSLNFSIVTGQKCCVAYECIELNMEDELLQLRYESCSESTHFAFSL